MSLSPWAERESNSGGWIRRMFLEGQRLKEEFGAEAVADLSIGQPLEASEAVREAFIAAAAEEFPGRFGYMANAGYLDVRTRCAQDVGHGGVNAASITMTCGAAGAIALALRAFVNSGDEVIGVAPYFPEFRLYAATLGSPFVVIGSGENSGVDLDALAEALTPTTGALLVNSPCNPTGYVLRDADLTGIASVLTAHNRRYGRQVLLIVDEVYWRLTYAPTRRADPLAHYEHCVLARSFSKDLGVAGERIGYLVVHPSMTSARTTRGLEMCARALGFVNASATAQRALMHLLSWDIDLAPYQQRREAALTAVNAAGIDAGAPDGGLYLWARSPWPDTITFVNALAERHVLVTPGIAFGVESHFRVCFSQPLAAFALAQRAIADTVAIGADGAGASAIVRHVSVTDE